MATQVCNISCEGCTNYSDLPHKGYVPWKKFKSEFTPWLDLLEIPDFGIMGGEPLINPEITDWLSGSRELLPTSQIRFTTNGLLLSKHMDVVDCAHSIGNVVFKISVHTNSTELEQTIQEIFSRYQWEPVVEFGIHRWKTTNGMRFQVNRPTEFVKTYQGAYHNMMPYDSSITESFAACIQQTCPLLHNGAIYKCSTQGLLKETLARVGNPNLEHWAPYLIDGITINSSRDVIQNFVNNFSKPAKICQMCPSKKDTAAFIKHKAIIKNGR